MHTKKIFFASDIKGASLRKSLASYAKELKIPFEELSLTKSSPLDLLDLIKQFALKFSSRDAYGVFISDEAQKVSIAANKFPFIRAALVSSKEDIEKARKQLDANVLCLNGQIDQKKAVAFLDTFFFQEFEKKNHQKTIEKLSSFATVHADKGVNLIVRAVICHQDHILLSTTTKHNQEFAKDLFFLPGGHVDHNESAISALKREILEEMYLTVDDLSFAGALECSWNKKGRIYHEINLVYRVDISGLSLKRPPKSSEPFIQFVWRPLSKISEYKLLPHELIPMLQEIEKNKTKAPFYTQMTEII